MPEYHQTHRDAVERTAALLLDGQRPKTLSEAQALAQRRYKDYRLALHTQLLGQSPAYETLRARCAWIHAESLCVDLARLERAPVSRLKAS